MTGLLHITGLWSQLTHDVVATLGFGFILVATSYNVVTTLCFWRRYYDQNLTTSAFRPGINVAATLWLWSRFPDKNLKVFQYHYNFLFPWICNIALQFHFLINKIYSLCVNTKRSLKWWITENLQLVVWTEKRDFWSCLVYWSETAPFFLLVNSVGWWSNYFLHSGNQNRGIIPICHDGY